MTKRLLSLLTIAAAALIAATVGIAAQKASGTGAAGRMIPPKEEPIQLSSTTIGASPRGNVGEIGEADCAIGVTKELCRARVIGESVRPAPEYRFVVAIYFDRADGKRYICTGILLTRQLVLTAGHCGCGIRGTYTVDVRQDTRTGDERRIANVDGDPILYDKRVCTDGLLDEGRDLALLRLHTAVRDSDMPVYGYPRDTIWQLRAKLPTGRRLIAVGYGYTDNGQLGVRMQGTIPVLTADCTSKRFSSICAPFAEMILADAPGPRIRSDTCGGDSGGPIFVMGDDNLPTLVGVTSRAAPGVQDNPTLHCGGGGIYALIGRVSVHAWLQANGVP